MTNIDIAEGYRPTEAEPFMNERQREYFRRKLLRWKGDILKEARKPWPPSKTKTRTTRTLRTGLLPKPTGPSNSGPATASASSSPRSMLPSPHRRRQLRLLRGDRRTDLLKRLEARPIATLSIEAQERHERNERVYRDD